MILQIKQMWLLVGFSANRVPFDAFITFGSESKLSLILSHIISTKRSNTALTLIFSLADVSKNSNPN
ncbi:hypothetical protein DERF_004959 [Dermatophagoides farinae]|uniref:Uncharacterized protein n=1 Tax=Dermatophagoides farinae TaxID=6954 RepID=A0A922LAP5_DERFA|nr:hypothetical protein DERF_004959 [Dermatophagoides farinae]